MTTYTFHVSLVSKTDRREHQILSYEQHAPSLNSAFDEAEAYFAEQHPDQDVSISLSGSLLSEPFPVPKRKRFGATLGDLIGDQRFPLLGNLVKAPTLDELVGNLIKAV